MNRDNLCAMNIHYRYYSLEYFFESCQLNGFKNAELWLCPQHFFINYCDSEDPEILVELIKKYDVNIACLTPEQNNPKPNNIAARSKLLINNTRLYFRKVIDLANYLHCPKVLVTPGWAYYDEPIKMATERSILMLQELCDYAKSFNIDLCMESIWKQSSNIAYDIKKVSTLKKKIERDNFKLTVDLGALGDAGESIEDWFIEFGNDIAHCHFVDGTPTGHMPWGMGNRNMANDLQEFYSNNYTGLFSLEYVNPVSYINPSQIDHMTVIKFEKAISKIGKNRKEVIT